MLLNLTTCGLIIFGGLGFYVIRELMQKRSWHALSVNTKIVLATSGFLLLIGTLLLKATNEITWLGAFFQSTSARTAGFSTYALNEFSTAGQFALILLMFVGASPGSTGGGVKTTTAFTLFRCLLSLFHPPRLHGTSAVKSRRRASSKRSPSPTLAAVVVSALTFVICAIEPHLTFLQVLFEVVSGFGTVGLSTGITPQLTDASKLLLCLTMFIGRLGPADHGVHLGIQALFQPFVRGREDRNRIRREFTW